MRPQLEETKTVLFDSCGIGLLASTPGRLRLRGLSASAEYPRGGRGGVATFVSADDLRGSRARDIHILKAVATPGPTGVRLRSAGARPPPRVASSRTRSDLPPLTRRPRGSRPATARRRPRSPSRRGRRGRSLRTRAGSARVVGRPPRARPPRRPARGRRPAPAPRGLVLITSRASAPALADSNFVEISTACSGRRARHAAHKLSKGTVLVPAPARAGGSNAASADATDASTRPSRSGIARVAARRSMCAARDRFLVNSLCAAREGGGLIRGLAAPQTDVTR